MSHVSVCVSGVYLRTKCELLKISNDFYMHNFPPRSVVFGGDVRRLRAQYANQMRLLNEASDRIRKVAADGLGSVGFERRCCRGYVVLVAD